MRQRLRQDLLVILVVVFPLVLPLWCWSQTLSGGMSDTLFIDLNSNTQVNPGDTLRYSTTITNTGAQPATNVQFTDTLDANTTLVPGSVRSTPVALDDSYPATGNTPLSISGAAGLLVNDINLDNDLLTITAPPLNTTAATTQGGTVRVQADGSFRYVPSTGFSGTDTFTYTIQDPEGSDTATVTFQVNLSPVAVADTYSVLEDTTLTVPAASGVLVNDTDAETDPLTAVLVSSVSQGILSLNADGSFTYTPTADFNGTDSFTYQASDGQSFSNIVTVTITVTTVNDAPTFIKGADQTVLEDSGAHSVPGWATSISPGPADEAGQTLTFVVTGNSNASLFSAGPAVAASGTLTYTPAANTTGSATITLVLQDNGGTANGGVNTSTPQTFVITVTTINDAPSFITGPDQTVLEDAGPQTVTGWATSISAGPPDEAGQTLTFVVTGNTNAGLFSAGPAVAANGTLTYTPAANANGTATITLELRDNGGTANGGVDTSPSQTFTITVTAVNDAPSFTKGADQTVFEDSGAHTVTGWATSMSPGPADEAGQTLTFVVTGNTNAGLFSAGPAVAANGTLTYTLAANAAGTATITLVVRDNGGTANGGIDTSAAQTFGIAVTGVNDAPGFTKGADQTVLEDAGPQTVTGWATSISAGPPDEAGQTLTFVITGNTNAGLFSAGPAVAATGTLTYTPTANANGSATLTLVLQDNGGTANGGVDTSPAQTFVITVTAVNDAPSFTKGADQTVLEDSGAHAVTGWATSMSPGPPDEAGQTLTFVITGNTNAGLFSAGPAVAATGTLTYTLVANANGSATLTLVLRDNGGAANGGVDTSPAQTFVITVTAVNDVPSFTTGPDQIVLEDSGTQTVAGWATSISAGPANESGQALTFVVTGNTNAGLFSAGPAVAATGTLTYTPAVNANGTATITLVVQDNGGTANGGVDTSPAQTFIITVTPVNDPPLVTAPGPFAVTGNVAILVPAPSLLSTVSDPADGPGAAPFTVSATDIPTLQGGVVSINPGTGAFSYNPPAGYTGADSFTYQVCDSGVPGRACTAATVNLTINDMIWFIDNNAAAGDGRLSSPFNALAAFQTINDGLGNHPGNGDTIFLFESATAYVGPVTLLNNQQLVGQDATASLDTIAGITLAPNSVPLPVMNSANGVIAAVVNTTATGVAIRLNSGANALIRGLTLGNVLASGTGIDNLGAGFGTLTILDAAINTDGRALNLLNGTLNATLSTTSSSGGPNNVLLTTITGTIALGSGALSGAAGTAFAVSGGTVAITYSGSISKTTGGRLIDIQSHGGGGITLSGTLSSTGTSTGINIANNTGGTLAFTGASKVVSTGANPAVTLSNNTGATIDFTGGGLALTTTSGAGFNATGGGTVTVQGAGNTIASTTGTALNVANTTIGGAGLTFQSISTNGSANGIVLNTTGNSGGLTVTGTGTAGSGGTIQNIINRGASFISAVSISLTHMNFTNTATAAGAPCGSAAVAGANTGCNAAINLQTVTTAVLDRLNITTSGQQGINGIDVTDLTLSNSALSGLGNAADEDGLHFHNMLGTNTISNTTIASSGDDNVNIQNLSATPSTITIGGGSFNTGVQGSGLLFGIRNTANTTIDISGVTVDNNFSGGIVADGFDTATLQINVTGCTITNNNDGIQVSANNGTSRFDIDTNTISGNDFLAITLLKAAFSTAGILEGAIRNNPITIGNGRTTDAISVFQAGGGALKTVITNNVINYAGTQRAILVQGGQDGNGSMDVTITGNTIDVQLDGTGNAVAGILAQTAITGPGNTTSLCADMGGTGAARNTFTHSLGGSMAAGDIRVRQRNDGTVRLPGYGGTATDTAAVIAYLDGRNTVVSASTTTADSTGFAGGGACLQPVIP